MVNIDDYRKRYKFLYDYVQNNPGFMSNLECILFPEDDSSVDVSSVKDIINSRISMMRDEFSGRANDFTVDDVLKALVTYGDISHEYGILLANSQKLASRRERFCRIPILQSVANFFMKPWDLIRAGLDCADEDWVNLQVCVLQSEDANIGATSSSKPRASDKAYSRNTSNPYNKPKYEVSGKIIRIKMN